MKYARVLFCAFLCLTLAACVERSDYAFPEAKPKIVLMSEISPESALSVEVSTSKSACCDSEITFPEDAELDLYEDGHLVGRLEVHRLTNSYVLGPGVEFQPKMGSEYAVSASVPDPEIESVRATTTIPAANAIEGTEFSNFQIETLEGFDDITFDARVALAEPDQLPAYYHIIPTRRFVTFSVDPQSGERTHTYLQAVEKLEVIDILSGKNAVTSDFEEGILIEHARLNGTMASFDLRLSTVERLNPENEALLDVRFIVRSVTKEYFDYHKALSKLTTGPDGPIPGPINVPSNVEQGLGLFGGYNMRVDSFLIQ